MKLLIVSDLHSNVEGIKAIWEKESDADAIYAAGDFVDYGTDPVAVIDWVRAHNVHCVRGNHDEKLMDVWDRDDFHGKTPDTYAWVHHNCERLDQEHVNFLKTLPSHLSFEADGIQYLMMHRYGKHYETIESQYHFDQYWAEHYSLPEIPGAPRRMIFGHSHRQTMQIFTDGGLWLNPGSASYRRPDEPSKDAFYAVIQDGRIEFRHTPYNRKPLYDEAVRVRSKMMLEEWIVANFFFGWTEEQGPDFPWMGYMARVPHVDMGNKT